ncbi:MAG: radical SAM protein [Acidobacteria bacterium]|nr:radical SAM protein [Acidobacteriota bacterium]
MEINTIENLKVKRYTGRDDVAVVYIATFGEGKSIEFVESLQPPLTREEKWVIIVSSLFGCPADCLICDAGGYYRGKLSAEQIFSQIDFLVEKRYPSKVIPSEKFKIQFARMGEPAWNLSVLDALEELPGRYDAPGLIPCISTIAPAGSDGFFDRLMKIKKKLYPKSFQLQFSVHTTDENLRDKIIPVKKMPLKKIAEYGEKFFDEGGRKITLNFALIKGAEVDMEKLLSIFDPEMFLIKMTPLNPTFKARENGLLPYDNPGEFESYMPLYNRIVESGYEAIISIGELEENKIGSNCGQYIRKAAKSETEIEGYKYPTVDY